MIRTVVVMPRQPVSESISDNKSERSEAQMPRPESQRDEEIWQWIYGDNGDGHLKKVKHGKDLFFGRPPTSSGKATKLMFWVGPKESRGFAVRFSSPSDDVKGILERQKNGWYLPDSLSASEAISLIERHANEYHTRANATD
jgi:hypothetical protein